MTHCDPIYSKTRIKKVLSNNAINLKKAFGQNLLMDLNTCQTIASAAGPLTSEVVIEIGPGLGNLTQAILQNNPQELITIEKDLSLKSALENLRIKNKNLTIIFDDALKIPLSQIIKTQVHIFGNLPYNIATQLIFKWIQEISLVKSLTLTLQAEVVDRICATPDSKVYGKLGVLCQLVFNCSKLLDIEPEMFFPVPKVSSATVRMIPKTKVSEEIFKVTSLITSSAFMHRRKMLRHSLKSVFFSPEAACDFASIDSRSRAENVSVEQYVQLSKYWINLKIKESNIGENINYGVR